MNEVIVVVIKSFLHKLDIVYFEVLFAYFGILVLIKLPETVCGVTAASACFHFTVKANDADPSPKGPVGSDWPSPVA